MITAPGVRESADRAPKVEVLERKRPGDGPAFLNFRPADTLLIEFPGIPKSDVLIQPRARSPLPAPRSSPGKPDNADVNSPVCVHAVAIQATDVVHSVKLSALLISCQGSDFYLTFKSFKCQYQ